MAEPRHFAMPFRFERLRDGRARVASTLQGTTEEIADCVECVVRTTAGERATLPDFGRPAFEFTISPEVARGQLTTAIDEAEPRARAVIEGEFATDDPGALRVRVMYELRGEIG